MNDRRLPGLLAVCAVWGWAPAAEACSCAIRPPMLFADALFDGARAVFVGEPYALTPATGGHGFLEGFFVAFNIEESWKGVQGTRVGVVTSGDEAACGVRFQIGRTYVVYAFEDDGELHATLCSVKEGEAVEAERNALRDAAVSPLVLYEGADRLFPPHAAEDPDQPDVNPPAIPSLCGVGALGVALTLVVAWMGHGGWRRAGRRGLQD